MRDFANKNKVVIRISTIVGFSIAALAAIYCLKHAYIVTVNRDIYTFLDASEYIFYIFLAGSIVLSGKYSFKQIIGLILVGIILTLGYLSSSYAALLKAFFIVIAVKELDFYNICQDIYKALLIGTLAVLFMYSIGISDAGIGRRGFVSFGFVTPNVASYIVQTICFLKLYMMAKNQKYKRWSYLIYPILGVGVYFLLGSRNSAFIIAVAPYVVAVLSKIMANRKRKIILVLMEMIPIICMFITMLTAVLYDKSRVVQRLNNLFNARIFLNYYNLKKYGIMLLGQKTAYSSDNYLYNPVTNQYSTFNTIDSSYMCLILQFGICVMVIWIISQMWLIHKFWAEEQYQLMAITLLLFAFGLFESSVLEFVIDFPVICLLAKKNSRNMEYEEISRAS